MNKVKQFSTKLFRVTQYAFLAVVLLACLSFALLPVYGGVSAIMSIGDSDRVTEYDVSYEEASISSADTSEEISSDIFLDVEELSDDEEHVLSEARTDSRVTFTENDDVPELFTEDKTIALADNDRVYLFEVNEDKPDTYVEELMLLVLLTVFVTVIFGAIGLGVASTVLEVYEDAGLIQSSE